MFNENLFVSHYNVIYITYLVSRHRISTHVSCGAAGVINYKIPVAMEEAKTTCK